MTRKIPLKRLALAALGCMIVVALAIVFAVRYFSIEQRFARSKSALDAIAIQIMATRPDTPFNLPEHIGDIEASDLHRLAHGFYFRSDFGNPFDFNGLAYSTEPLPDRLTDPNVPNGGDPLLEHLNGNWYLLWGF